MESHVPYYLQHQYKLYDRTLKTGITNICNIPEKTLTIDNQGNCLLCVCDGWLPISVGHITDFTSIEEVWQTELAKKIKKDLEDKKYTWCSVDYCGIKNTNKIMEQYYISINIDESCNLQCPTCRSFFMNFTEGKIYENKLSWANHIVKLLEKFDKPSTITMSGNGDPFASLIYRPLLMSIKPNNKHRYKIMTNGLLLKKLLTKSSIYNNIQEYSISVDAGDAETYEKVRLKGKWNILLENLNFLKQKLINKNKLVNLNFCLHKENLKSLLNFVELVEKYQWNGNIQSIEDWSTIKNFDYQNVLNNNNELFGVTIETLKLISKNKRIFLSGKIQELIKNN
jgi:MoaA/NifB/PqqE/SkfB family radical SAM enzyme